MNGALIGFTGSMLADFCRWSTMTFLRIVIAL
jgi:hypothetical protein